MSVRMHGNRVCPEENDLPCPVCTSRIDAAEQARDFPETSDVEAEGEARIMVFGREP